MVCPDELANQPPKRPPSKLKKLNKWFVWRLGAICFWYWFIALRGHSLDVPQLQHLGLVGLLPVGRWLLNRKWWLGLLAMPAAGIYYFAIFPFIGLYWSVRAIPRIFRIPTSTFRVLTSTVGFGISFVFFVGILSAAQSISDPLALKVLGYTTLALMNILLLCGLSWSSHPLSPILTGSRWASKAGRWLVGSWTKAAAGSKTSSESWRALAAGAKDFLESHIVDEEGRLRSINSIRRALGPLFTSVAVSLFLTLVTGYAVVYYMFAKAGSTVLPSLRTGASLGAAWYQSLTISMTALHAGTIPASTVGRLIQSFHLLDAVLFLTCAVFLFTYAMGARGEKELLQIRDYPQRVHRELTAWISELDAGKALQAPSDETVDIEEESEENDATGTEE